MAKYERVDGLTPNGGDYSEIHYFNDKGESVDEKKATKCVIRELKKDGTLISETWGNVN